MAVAVMSRPDVVVIGAGFAGLSAAVRAVQRGARVLVLESRGRLGGRATAFHDHTAGEVVDNGQHVLTGGYVETFEFLEAIDASDHVRVQPGLSVTMVDRAGRRTRLECPNLPPPLHLFAGVIEWDAIGWRDRLAVLRMAAPLRLARRALRPGSNVLAASPGETVTNWLIRNGQTARIREMLWDPLALAALNQSPDSAAAPVFTRVLAEMFGPDPRAAAIAMPTRPLHEMYALPARAHIEARGGLVRTGATATVHIEGHRPIVASGDERWQPDAVVAAVPWFALPTLFSGDIAPLAETIRRARATAASPIVTVNLWFDRPILDEAFVGLPGRRMQWVFDKRFVFGDSASHLSLVSSGAAAMLDVANPQLIAAAHAELRDAFPACREAHLIRGTVIREPHATFSLAPGQPLRPDVRTAVPGLFLAGDWIDTGLPATIESAVRSGHRAADAALAHGARG
jgi:squalene-associated FAD-dependent desaturase